MISTILLKLGALPRWFYVSVAGLVAFWLFASHYLDKGREEVLDELRQAEADKAVLTAESSAKADKEASEAVDEIDEETGKDLQAIKEARSNEENPLDSIF